jgi:hypothetical protein
MGIVTERWIFCDICGHTTCDGRKDYPSIKALKEDCKISGWINIKGNDVCPDCQKDKDQLALLNSNEDDESSLKS